MNPVPMLTAAVTANPFDEDAKRALADALTDDTGDHERAWGSVNRVTLDARIAALVAQADELTRQHWETNKITYSPPETHRADYISDKWVRIVVIEHREPGDAGQVRRVYAFVCLRDYSTKGLGSCKAGDIHKPDGFKRPAKHARGSVFSKDFGNCLSVYGPNYLRGW